jgi:polysaccharide pyruvyl transferase WcaK-like protein
MISQQEQVEPAQITMPSAKPVKIGVLGATFETGNMGLGALAAGTIQCLRNRFPGACVFLLDFSREPTVRAARIGGQQLDVPLLNMRFSKKIFLSNNIAVLILLTLVAKLIPATKARRRFLCKNRYLREIAETQFFVALAGGDSFADIYGFGRLIYVTLPQWLILLCGKRLILMPQTYGPFKGRMARKIARSILRGAEIVYSRDLAGVKDTRAMLGIPEDSSKVRFCHDVGFLLEPAEPAHTEIAGIALACRAGSNLIGLNISGLLFMEGYTRNNMFGLKVNYAELTRNLIKHLLKDTNNKLLLIPHVFGEDTETDSLACEKIFAELGAEFEGRLGTVRGRYNQNEIKWIIGQCDFFIGSRMHACIAATSQAVPAVSVAYSDKFIGVMKTIGVESLVADPRKMNSDEILQHVDRHFLERDQIRRQLEQTMPLVKKSILDTISQGIDDSWQSP